MDKFVKACSYQTSILIFLLTFICCTREIDDSKGKTSVERIKSCRDLTPGLIGYVDWGTHSYQHPSALLSDRSRVEFLELLLIIAASFVLFSIIKLSERKKDLYATWYLKVVILQCVSTSTLGGPILLQQTVPANDLVCPGQQLVYSCTTVSGAVQWETSGEEPVLFQVTDAVNMPMSQNQFVFQLIFTDVTNLTMISTATSKMANSVLDGVEIECYDGKNRSVLYVDVAEPANCSNISVDCEVIPNAMGQSEVDVQIQLVTNSQFMCAVDYLVEFNGETKTVPFGSPSLNFTVDKLKEKYSLEGMIYTLDNESRTGQIPCSFSIPGPSAVKNVSVVGSSNTNEYFVIRWKPSEITECLNNNTRLEYTVQFPFGNANLSLTTSDLFVTLPCSTELQNTDYEITITPVLTDLQVTGTPLSTSLSAKATICLNKIVSLPDPTASTTTPTANVSAEGDDNSMYIIGLSVLSALYVGTLFVSVIVCCFLRQKRGKAVPELQPSVMIKCSMYKLRF